MSRRFIDKSAFPKQFRKLSPNSKLTVYYLWTNCDKAGVWEIDEDLFEFENGIEFDLTDLKSPLLDLIAFNKEIIVLKDFVFVDQKGNIKENYNPHKPIIVSMQKNNLGYDSVSKKMYIAETPTNIIKTPFEPAITMLKEDSVTVKEVEINTNALETPTNKGLNNKKPANTKEFKPSPSLNNNTSNLNQASNNNFKACVKGTGNGKGNGKGKGSGILSNVNNNSDSKNFLNLSDEEESEIFGPQSSKEERDVVGGLMHFFGFRHDVNFDKLRICSNFIKTLRYQELLNNFIEQFEAYKIFKNESKQIVHGFKKFIGSSEICFEDGAWNAENWVEKATKYTVKLETISEQQESLLSKIDY
jgi:hypothetical protein